MTSQHNTVAVVTPAGIPDPEQLARGVALLESWGLRVSTGAHVAEQFRYFAGNHAQRTGDLVDALRDPAVDVVWIARGGYGCTHLLTSLPDAVPCDKTVIGFSDVTALFCALRGMDRVRLIHGPTLTSLVATVDDASRDSARAALTGAAQPPLPLTLLHGAAGTVEGPLVGGNVTVLASIAGSRWQPRFQDSIVVLEDVTELAYRLDRSLMTLRHAGMFDGARAIVLGEFVRCPLPPGADYTLDDVLLDVLGPLGIPVYSGMPVGHAERNVSWVVGQRAVIEGGALLR